MLRYSCPKCDTFLEFDEAVRGSVVACHSCDGKFRIPAVNVPSAPPPLPSVESAMPQPLPLLTAAGPPPIPPATEDWPDLAPEPYHADGGMAPAGSLVVLGICLVVSVLLGALASFIGQWFYLILVFPVAIGFGVGMAGVLAVYWGKVRAPWWAGLVGFLAGCFAMATVQYVDYLRFKKQIPGIPIGFFQYVDLRAEAGVTIGRMRAPKQGGGMNLGYTGSYIYWFVETLIVAGIAFALMMTKAGEPFCRECVRWKKKRFLGNIHADIGPAVQAIELGDLHFLERHHVPNGGNFTIKVCVCPDCETEGPFELQLHPEAKNQKYQHQPAPLAQATYPGYGLPVLEEVFGKHRVSSDL